MNDWSMCTAIESLAAKVSEAWVFEGTRVPAIGLFNNLRYGAAAPSSVLASSLIRGLRWCPVQI